MKFLFDLTCNLRLTQQNLTNRNIRQIKLNKATAVTVISHQPGSTWYAMDINEKKSVAKNIGIDDLAKHEKSVILFKWLTAQHIKILIINFSALYDVPGNAVFPQIKGRFVSIYCLYPIPTIDGIPSSWKIYSAKEPIFQDASYLPRVGGSINYDMHSH